MGAQCCSYYQQSIFTDQEIEEYNQQQQKIKLTKQDLVMLFVLFAQYQEEVKAKQIQGFQTFMFGIQSSDALNSNTQLEPLTQKEKPQTTIQEVQIPKKNVVKQKIIKSKPQLL